MLRHVCVEHYVDNELSDVTVHAVWNILHYIATVFLQYKLESGRKMVIFQHALVRVPNRNRMLSPNNELI